MELYKDMQNIEYKYILRNGRKKKMALQLLQ